MSSLIEVHLHCYGGLLASGGCGGGGVAINGGGKVCNFDLVFFPRKTYRLTIHKLYTICGLIIHKFYITYRLSIRKKLTD